MWVGRSVGRVGIHSHCLHVVACIHGLNGHPRHVSHVRMCSAATLEVGPSVCRQTQAFVPLRRLRLAFFVLVLEVGYCLSADCLENCCSLRFVEPLAEVGAIVLNHTAAAPVLDALLDLLLPVQPPAKRLMGVLL